LAPALTPDPDDTDEHIAEWSGTEPAWLADILNHEHVDEPVDDDLLEEFVVRSDNGKTRTGGRHRTSWTRGVGPRLAAPSEIYWCATRNLTLPSPTSASSTSFSSIAAAPDSRKTRAPPVSTT
jgi:hypothetical protein